MKQHIVLGDEVVAVAGVAVFVVLCVHEQLDDVFGVDESFLFFLRSFDGDAVDRENVVVVTAKLGQVTLAIHPLNIHANDRTSILPDRIHRNDRDFLESRHLLKIFIGISQLPLSLHSLI